MLCLWSQRTLNEAHPEMETTAQTINTTNNSPFAMINALLQNIRCIKSLKKTHKWVSNMNHQFEQLQLLVLTKLCIKHKQLPWRICMAEQIWAELFTALVLQKAF